MGDRVTNRCVNNTENILKRKKKAKPKEHQDDQLEFMRLMLWTVQRSMQSQKCAHKWGGYTTGCSQELLRGVSCCWRSDSCGWMNEWLWSWQCRWQSCTPNDEVCNGYTGLSGDSKLLGYLISEQVLRNIWIFQRTNHLQSYTLPSSALFW